MPLSAASEPCHFVQHNRSLQPCSTQNTQLRTVRPLDGLHRFMPGPRVSDFVLFDGFFDAFLDGRFDGTCTMANVWSPCGRARQCSGTRTPSRAAPRSLQPPACPTLRRAPPAPPWPPPAPLPLLPWPAESGRGGKVSRFHPTAAVLHCIHHEAVLLQWPAAFGMCASSLRQTLGPILVPAASRWGVKPPPWVKY